MKELHQKLLALLDETNAILVLDLFQDWIRKKPTRAMIFQKDGISVHLISKRELLDDLKDAWKKSTNENDLTEHI